MTSLARDPFTGRVYLSLYGGTVVARSGKGQDLGVFAKGATSGRLSIAPDGFLYFLNPAPDGTAKIERFALPVKW